MRGHTEHQNSLECPAPAEEEGAQMDPQTVLPSAAGDKNIPKHKKGSFVVTVVFSIVSSERGFETTICFPTLFTY